ncbi:MAG: glycoside hydrolase [Sarcina sp.]
MKKKNLKLILGIAGIVVIMGSGIIIAQIFAKNSNLIGVANEKANVLKGQLEKANDLQFEYNVNPQTFEITTTVNGDTEVATNSLPSMKVSNLKKTKNSISWTYPEKSINVEIVKEDDYLNVKIISTSKAENSFQWANISGPDYTMPIGEGKYIPSNNADFKKYFNGYKDTTLSMLSMPFFAVNKKDYAIMYIMNNQFNNNISFNTDNNISFTVNHEFPSINPNKSFSYRIYVTPNNSVDIAKTFKNYVVKKGEFTTIQEKEEKNPNVKKLVGAPEIYLWDSYVMDLSNVNWQELNKNMPSGLKNWIISLLQNDPNGVGSIQSFNDIGKNDYLDKYDRNQILNGFTEVVKMRNFYNPKIFTNLTQQEKELINQGIDNLSEVQVITLNKMLLKSELGNIVQPVDEWSDASTTSMLNDMKQSGINKLWIGLSDWDYAYLKPDLVKDADKLGYLIAPYDSYNMVEKQGDINSNTASFPGTNLYNDAVIENKNSEIVKGFKGRGRTLNPTLVMPQVKKRMGTILKNIPGFNSWFMDCDAAGQIYNDYSLNHTTTKKEDLEARVARLAYASNDKNLVVGSERGDSYASQAIDFAQGIESPPFAWSEKGARVKTSPYYVGSYYAPTGGVPSIFGKQVPVRPWIYETIMSPQYTVPLYKMVYNNSVITTDHWLWGTFKVKGLTKERYLRDFLYNVPALYHLDANAWANQKSTIVAENKVFEPFSNIVTNEEMTNFEILSKNRLVQMTEFGNNVKVIVNFSKETVQEEGVTIKPQSLVIFEGNKKIYYTPQVLSQNL